MSPHSTPRARPVLRPLDPQMRVDIAAANAAFQSALTKHAPVKLLGPAPHLESTQGQKSATKRFGGSPSQEGTKLTLEEPFSLAGLSTLDEPVRASHLPEELRVYDRGNVTGRPTRRPDSALRYVRVYPRPAKAREGVPMRRGYLFLDRANQLADGRRAEVYRAPLFATLGPRGSGSAPRNVEVAAKLAKGDCRSQYLLRQEGKAYTHVEASGAQDGDAPLVPHFYGLYVPVDAKGRKLCGEHPHCDGYLHSDCEVEWPSPILLMENCGVPIELRKMNRAARKECWSVIENLHAAGVAHGSAYTRNMLVQPGPLDVPRAQRSLATPSYRIASLGRTEVLYARGAPSRLATNSFEKARERDMQLGMFELRPWENDPPVVDEEE